MTLMEKCQIWNDNDEYQKIVDAIEVLPEEERTPELCSELARAYNNLADPGTAEGRAQLRRALDLLRPYEETLKDDHCWNFRMAYAYYYLDQEGPALPYFERALEKRPGDEDTQYFIDACRRGLALPRFQRNFRERTQEAWEAFVQGEAELRGLMDQEDRDAVAEELIAKCDAILHLAFETIAFEMGYNGEKYELILTPEGDRTRLFELVYFQRHAPADVRKQWNILVGRQKTAGFALRIDDWEIEAQDVQVWGEAQGEETAALTLYCEKLLPLLREEENKVWWMLSTLTDQVLGEIPAMALIDGFDVLDAPRDGVSVSLEELPQKLADMGMRTDWDAAAYLENHYTAYELEPNQDVDADWRMDVFAGSTCCPALVNGYLSNQSETMDAFHQNGAVPGFFCYPVDGFTGAERGKVLLDFRDALEEAVRKAAGEDAVTFVGGASGLRCGYLDFIAWDLPAVLNAAAEFLETSPVAWANFHTFRRDVGTVRLINRENDAPVVDEQTGSLLSQEDIAALAAFEEGSSGYFGRMWSYLNDFISTGVAEGRFTQQQAREDLQIALWYAYAWNNLDEYDSYYKAAQWMPASEKNAQGCGTWYYRYSVALMYCGRLEEAWQYAETGAQEEPDYPWIWLQVAKLRSHFGNREGALEAVRRGLALEPGDHEFQTLGREIEAGAPLETMEYHWIDPDCDQALQDGLDEGADDKRRAISCIVLDPESLKWVKELLQPTDWVADAPYCSFHMPVQDQRVEVVFLMNEAGLSKLKHTWLEEQKARLESGQWLTHTREDGRTGALEAVMIGLDYRIGLLYRLEKDGTRFQIFLQPDGTAAEHAIWEEEPPEAGGEKTSAAQQEDDDDRTGSFVGFVLLQQAQWSREQLIGDLKTEWGIDAAEDKAEEPEGSDDVMVFSVEDMMVAVSLMPAPVPDHEAEANAGNNYMWPEAVEAARAHQGHLMVAVLGKNADLFERGKLFVKVMACCCRQQYASGVYTSGTVFEPRFYQCFAEMMKEDELPIFNWIWFGLYRTEQGVCSYTYGMDVFGKEEMEVLDAAAQPSEVRDFLASLVSYVLGCDVTLQDGETIGFSPEDKHSITRGPGVSLPGTTLKISYEAMEE